MHIAINNKTKHRIPRARLEAVAKHVLKLRKVNKDISIACVGKSEMKKLNASYRKKNYPTDVLSFPDDSKDYLGEIIICMEVAKSDAQELKITLLEELEILLVHGIVHLLGYDHITDQEAQKMEQLEKKIHKELRNI